MLQWVQRQLQTSEKSRLAAGVSGGNGSGNATVAALVPEATQQVTCAI